MNKLNSFFREKLKKLKDFYNYSIIFFFSNFLNKSLLHVIGDSHAISFEGDPLFVWHHLGPATAHNLKNKNSKTGSNIKLFTIINNLISKKDIVILNFGEIDCRIHIYYQYHKNKKKISISKLIENTISNYGEVLNKVKKKNINFFVLSIAPASNQDNFYDYPFYGSKEIRSKIHKEFNEKLKRYCKIKNYNFIDIYPKVSDKKGLILKKYKRDEIHLNKNILPLVKKELREHGVNLNKFHRVRFLIHPVKDYKK